MSWTVGQRGQHCGNSWHILNGCYSVDHSCYDCGMVHQPNAKEGKELPREGTKRVVPHLLVYPNYTFFTFSGLCLVTWIYSRLY